jgi:hypothetical protein
MSWRLAVVLGLFSWWGGGQVAPEEKPLARYGIEPRLQTYPQSTPKETLASVIAAFEARRIPYLLAQLSDPDFVDKRVKEFYSGQFDELVRETSMKLADNPAMVKELRRFLKEGEWEERENAANVKLKDVKNHQVFFRKIGSRWYLENRQKPEVSK